MTGSAAGRVLLNSEDRGSGFAIAASRALTSGHVVRDATKMAGGRHRPAAGSSGPVLVCVVDGCEPGEVLAVVEYQPEDGELITVTRIEVSTAWMWRYCTCSGQHRRCCGPDRSLLERSGGWEPGRILKPRR